MEAIKKDESSHKSRKPNLPVPALVARTLIQLGHDLNRARRRRNFSQADVAQRIGASLNTVKRLENGDPHVAIHFLARTLYLFGELDRLDKLIDSGEDDIGLILADERLPKRVRKSKKSARTAF